MKTQCYMIIESFSKKENKTIRSQSHTHIHILNNVMQYKQKVQKHRKKKVTEKHQSLYNFYFHFYSISY